MTTLTREEKLASAQKSAADLAAIEKKYRQAPKPAVKAEPKPKPKPPTKYEKLKQVASDVASATKDKMYSVVPELNKEYNEVRRKKIDEAVDGKEEE